MGPRFRKSQLQLAMSMPLNATLEGVPFYNVANRNGDGFINDLVGQGINADLRHIVGRASS
jgi:hypothetical protein